jgi:hypothetical protein
VKWLWHVKDVFFRRKEDALQCTFQGFLLNSLLV